MRVFPGSVPIHAIKNPSHIVPSECCFAFQQVWNIGSELSDTRYSLVSFLVIWLHSATNSVTLCSYNSLNVWYQSEICSLSDSGRAFTCSWIVIFLQIRKVFMYRLTRIRVREYPLPRITSDRGELVDCHSWLFYAVDERIVYVLQESLNGFMSRDESCKNYFHSE